MFSRTAASEAYSTGRLWSRTRTRSRTSCSRSRDERGASSSSWIPAHGQFRLCIRARSPRSRLCIEICVRFIPQQRPRCVACHRDDPRCETGLPGRKIPPRVGGLRVNVVAQQDQSMIVPVGATVDDEGGGTPKAPPEHASSVVSASRRSGSSSLPDEIVRDGARRILAAALRAGVTPASSRSPMRSVSTVDGRWSVTATAPGGRSPLNRREGSGSDRVPPDLDRRPGSAPRPIARR
jgi:hypothetical protein